MLTTQEHYSLADIPIQAGRNFNHTMNHKKILYITPALSVGGAEKFLILLSNSLINEKEKQIVVSLQAVNTLQAELDKKINFIALPRKYKFDLNPVSKLRRLIKTEQPSVIFCINFYSLFRDPLRYDWIKNKKPESDFLSQHNSCYQKGTFVA